MKSTVDISFGDDSEPLSVDSGRAEESGTREEASFLFWETHPAGSSRIQQGPSKEELESTGVERVSWDGSVG